MPGEKKSKYGKNNDDERHHKTCHIQRRTHHNMICIDCRKYNKHTKENEVEKKKKV